MAMKIDFVSDLHVDFWWHTTKPYSKDGPQPVRKDGCSQYIDWEWYRAQAGNDGEVLVIGGDISNSIDDVRKVVANAADVYASVVFVDGNHEHYNLRSYCENMIDYNDMQTEKVTFLHENAPFVVKGNTMFLGLNGWYDWRCFEPDFSHNDAYEEWQRNMSDYNCILFDEGKPDVLADRQAQCLAKALDQMAEKVDNVVVVTHTVPSAALAEVRHVSWNRLIPSFVNSQMASVRGSNGANKIRFWLYGHAHRRQDTVVDGIRYVNNSVGYPREQGVWRLQRIEV
jgi:predicted phosphodiesterase